MAATGSREGVSPQLANDGMWDSEQQQYPQRRWRPSGGGACQHPQQTNSVWDSKQQWLRGVQGTQADIRGASASGTQAGRACQHSQQTTACGTANSNSNCSAEAASGGGVSPQPANNSSVGQQTATATAAQRQLAGGAYHHSWQTTAMWDSEQQCRPRREGTQWRGMSPQLANNSNVGQHSGNSNHSAKAAGGAYPHSQHDASSLRC
ncbi:hypothetical protein DFH94DRAFT_811818 [Russula ochroleuca]|jgi:hypothetical protein|uniref:Uncharacterized protein n=1 Tax=Russula ochroleuca TaxID=152965 RepID=A0A9P5MPN9_9AGAM|nr:hypothetical protein DFH94DRAFT_811818 [Russula ochroleuca]